MLIAILTDVHANREALDACLADALGKGAERFVFLGDIVGYGADPVYCADRVIEWVGRGAVALRGNHDSAIAEGGEGMNSVAREAISWTQRQLSSGHRKFLAGLPLSHAEDDRLFVHSEASAPQQWIYVTSTHEARHSLAATQSRLTFCGHVHFPQLYGTTIGGYVVGYPIEADAIVHLAPELRWLSVIGAVGQPRDRDRRACYGLLDVGRSLLVMRRVDYDERAAAAKIVAAGLPRILAQRLLVGT